jgi:hypothetical protein
MRVRGDKQGSLPWDTEKEGPEQKLCDLLDQFLNDTFARNRKAMFRNAILKVGRLLRLCAARSKCRGACSFVGEERRCCIRASKTTAVAAQSSGRAIIEPSCVRHALEKSVF